jgi:opacity protein-like surface antigen
MKIKTIVFFAVILFPSYATVIAQTEKKPEFFAGYSFESVDTGIRSSDFISTTTSLDNRFKVNGLNASAAGYFTKRFGVAAEFSAHFNTRADNIGASASTSKFSLYNITGGPQFRFPNTSRLTPFVHAMAGIARRNLSETLTGGGTTTFTDNNTSFAMNFGGGADYKLSDRFSWRVAQFDYNPIFLRSRTFNSVTFSDRTLNGFRFSTGIVIK